MKKRSLVITLITVMALSVILFILKQYQLLYFTSSFIIIIFALLVSILIMENSLKKKLDKRYKVLTKDNLVKEYDKIKALKDKDKIKAFCLVYFKLKEEYLDEEISSFGKYLKTKFQIDPIGFDDGLVVIVVNMHEIMIKELIKIIKKDMKENIDNFNFSVKYSFYTNDESYDDLINELKR